MYGDVIVKTNWKDPRHYTAHHTSQWALHQQLLIDQEYAAKIEYYEGVLSLGADGLSKIEQDGHQLTKWKF